MVQAERIVVYDLFAGFRLPSHRRHTTGMAGVSGRTIARHLAEGKCLGAQALSCEPR